MKIPNHSILYSIADLSSFLERNVKNYYFYIIRGETDLTALYAMLAEHPKSKGNEHYKERIRATIYEHKEQYVSCGNGTYRLNYKVA